MQAPPAGLDGLRILLTAAEAYPALEREFLRAEERISLGFRIFDPKTRLRSDEARAIGEDWFDLVAHTLARGVRITTVISDFDAIVRPDYHRRAQNCLALLLAAAEASGRPDLLRARAAIHPARTGWLASVVLWPRARDFLAATLRGLNEMTPPQRTRRMRELPLLAPYFVIRGQAVRLRNGRLPRLTPVTHHQKLAVFDGRRLYVGGLDLNERRYDTPMHDRPAEETWHDCQLLIEDERAAEAERHLATFLPAIESRAEIPDTPGILRTLSRPRRIGWPFLSPKPLRNELEHAHRDLTDRSTGLIYLESQFFRDTRFARKLARAARRTPDLGLILILPAAPDDVSFRHNSGSDARFSEYLQAKSIAILRRAFGKRMFIGAPAQCRTARAHDRSTIYGAPLIYLHAKVSIFDRAAAVVSSANLNGRSFRWDTEAGVLLDRPGDVEALRQRCAANWLGGPVDPAFVDPATAVRAWTARARANARTRPENRRGHILPYSSRPARRFGRNLPSIPEEMV